MTPFRGGTHGKMGYGVDDHDVFDDHNIGFFGEQGVYRTPLKTSPSYSSRCVRLFFKDTCNMSPQKDLPKPKPVHEPQPCSHDLQRE